MDRRIRQIAGLLTLLLLAVAFRVGYVQGVNADAIAANEPISPRDPSQRARNPFRVFDECQSERGAILSIDGQILAQSDPTTAPGPCAFERVYPEGPLAAHVVGWWSLHFGKLGLESAYNDVLVGDELPPESLGEFFMDRPRKGDNLVSTIDTRLQRTALESLGDRRGGVVALDPKTGAVHVAASNPSYDPTPVAANDRSVAVEARCGLGLGEDCTNPNSPMLSVALQSRRPPGSTFKVVTAAAALESGEYTATSPSAPSTGAYTAPGDTRPIGNYGGGSCGGNLTQALRVSCNTAFARFAVDVGADQFYRTAQAMGFDAFGGPDFIGCDGAPLADIREARTGCLPNELHRPAVEGDGGSLGCPQGGRLDRDRQLCIEPLEAPGFLARAGFGQWVIQASPFGMAVVAATIANGGFVPKPRFAERVLDPDTGETVREIRTGFGTQALADESAEALQQMMRNVVTSGTASRAFSGFRYTAAGKTGTAQQPSCAADEQAIFGAGCGRLPHAWFIAFAPVEDPTIAVAVLVERGGGANESATGGRLAAPIARDVIEEYFRLYPAAAGAS